MKDEHVCPRRAEAPYEIVPRPDAWEAKPNGDRCCSYCGSLHPEDMERIIESALEPGSGVNVSISDKRYKIYIRQPGVKNASEGGIKFYMHHFPQWRQDLIDKINSAAKIYWDRLHGKVPE